MTHQLSVNKRALGVTFSDQNKASVVVWAPKAKHMAIKVHERGAALPLKCEELGYWCLTTDQVKPGDLYTFILDGQTERPDPASLAQPQGVHGPSEAFDAAAFTWTDQNWVNPDLDTYLIYELHTSTFTPDGTFIALIDKLEHLKALGVNAIEIMPIAQFPDSRNWGYDGVFPYAAQSSYGGAKGLQQLVDACHAQGIAVVLDVVYNHFGPEGNHFKDFGPYLTSKYCTPWGQAMNFDDAWCDGVRRYVIENTLMWLRDFHLDALRLDAVHAIRDFSPVHILEELRKQVDQLIETTGRRHYLIVESDLNDPRLICPLSEHGYGMDAQWMDEFHHALRVTVGEERTGYYADYNGLDHLAKSYRDAYVYDGQFSKVRERLFGRKAESNPGRQFVIFSQNHDQIGNRKLGERSSQLYSFDATKLMASAVMISPYIPLLFMGEEWGETNPFLYFVSHTDPELVEAVRAGRREEFASFQSQSEQPLPDPQIKETFHQSKLQWELLDQEPHKTLLRYYQTLIALRKEQPALRCLNRWQMDVIQPEGQSTLIVHRWQEDSHVLGLMNFGKEAQTVTLPTMDKQWHKLLDSSEVQWQGSGSAEPGSAPETASDAETITLQPESFILYAKKHN